MTDEKTRTLVRRLISATKQSKLDWKADASPGEFVVAFPKYSIKIGMEQTRDGMDDDEDVVLTIMNGFGEIVESIRDTDFERNDLGESDEGYPFRILRKLFETARRKALGVEAAIDDLLSELPPAGEEFF